MAAFFPEPADTRNILISAAIASALAASVWWASTIARQPSERVLREPPGTIETYVRALYGAVTKRTYPLSLEGHAPVELELENAVVVDASRLEAYWNLISRILKTPQPLNRNEIPPVFLFVDSFRLVMLATAQPQFVFSAIGSVLAAGKIRMERAVSKDEKLKYAVKIDQARYAWSERQDAECWAETTATDESGKVVWKSEIKMVSLNPGRKKYQVHHEYVDTAPPDPVLASLDVPSYAGRAFGAISGDRNPIHMSFVTALVFGYCGAIAHANMLVGCLEAALRTLDKWDQRKFPLKIESEFKRPTFLPAKLNAVLKAQKSDGELDLALVYASGKSAGKEVIVSKVREGL